MIDISDLYEMLSSGSGKFRRNPFCTNKIDQLQKNFILENCPLPADEHEVEGKIEDFLNEMASLVDEIEHHAFNIGYMTAIKLIITALPDGVLKDLARVEELSA